jgi:hypothetical protein
LVATEGLAKISAPLRDIPEYCLFRNDAIAEVARTNFTAWDLVHRGDLLSDVRRLFQRLEEERRDEK